MPIIVLDPGHGGTVKVGGSSPNNAASKPRNILEKTLTLKVAKLAKAALEERNYTVHLTRSDDSNLGLSARADVAKSKKADVFLSIHFNGWKTPDVQGSEIYYHPDAPSRSQRLAKAVLPEVLGATGYKNRGVQAENFGVLNPVSHLASTAVSLVELSFITDPVEDARLDSLKYLTALARACVDGIENYLAGERPKTVKPIVEDGFKHKSGDELVS